MEVLKLLLEVRCSAREAGSERRLGCFKKGNNYQYYFAVFLIMIIV